MGFFSDAMTYMPDSEKVEFLTKTFQRLENNFVENICFDCFKIVLKNCLYFFRKIFFLNFRVQNSLVSPSTQADSSRDSDIQNPHIFLRPTGKDAVDFKISRIQDFKFSAEILLAMPANLRM